MKALKRSSRNLQTQSAQRTDHPTLSELLLNAPEAGDLPALGEHTDAVLSDLGYPPDSIAQWRSDGVL